jgi:EAL domain-containing protein (putative c-di-GMP-specific phosphodiesterase class I)
MVLDEEDRQLVAMPGPHLAFRPLYDLVGGRVFAYEAVLRGPDGEEGDEVFALLPPGQHAELHRRVIAAAIYRAMAAGLGETSARLLIPVHAAAAVDAHAALAAATEAGRRSGLVAERMIFAVHGYTDIPGQHLAEMVDGQRRAGSLTAFIGLGHDPVGFSPCARYRPAMVRLDRELVNGIDASWSRRLMLEELTPRLRDLGLRIIADGVERESVLPRLRGFGIFHIQGDLVAPAAPHRLPPTRLQRPAAAA